MTQILQRIKSSSLTFDALVERIRRTLSEGRARAEEAVDRERARTYWEAGKWIHIYELKGEDRAKYGDKLFLRLAAKTGLSKALLEEIHLFYREVPIVYARRQLAWTGFRHMLRVADSKKRLALIKEASQKNWTTHEIEAAVDEIQQKALPRAKGSRDRSASLDLSLTPKKGKFFTYQIVRAQNMHEGPGGLSLDLGFRFRREIDFKGIRNPKPGNIVQVVRTQKDPAGNDRYKIVHGPFKRSDLYTYKAKAEIYRDADTFWVDVDLGFRDWGEQKLRLRGIDAAELTEEAGRRAAAYVKKVLSRVSFIVITISGRDKFGRPLTDVFYLEGTDDREKVLAEGKFMNQELLDLGLARRSKEK